LINPGPTPTRRPRRRNFPRARHSGRHWELSPRSQPVSVLRSRYPRSSPNTEVEAIAVATTVSLGLREDVDRRDDLTRSKGILSISVKRYRHRICSTAPKAAGGQTIPATLSHRPSRAAERDSASLCPRFQLPPYAGCFLAPRGCSRIQGRWGGRGAVQNKIGQMGFVQVDSINAVERAHPLILATRLDAYRREDFVRLLEQDRSLFEHWTHCSVPSTRWWVSAGGSASTTASRFSRPQPSGSTAITSCPSWKASVW